MKKSVPALQIDLRPSRYLFAFILISHLGPLLFVFYLPLHGGLLLVAVIALLLSLRYYWQQHRYSVVLLRWRGEGGWILTDHLGHDQPAEILPGSYLHSALMVLRFKLKNKTLSLVLLSDSADENLLRQLRVRLKQNP